MSAGPAYARRIGRYGPELAAGFLRVSGIRPGWSVLDVGCGGGALTEPLAELVGPVNVTAVDPSRAAVAECRRRVPDARVEVAHAERLPFPDARFHAVLAQLLFGLLPDQPAVLAEMCRVARPGAPVATCAWDFAGGMTVLRVYWDAAHAVCPERAPAHDQANTHRNCTREGLAGIWTAGGLDDVRAGELLAHTRYGDFGDLWEPLVAADGAPGEFHATLDAGEQGALRREVWARLGSPHAAFELTARAWWVAGRAPG